MTNKSKLNNFFAVNFWNIKYSPVQDVVEKLCNHPEVNNLILTGCRQFGKSFWIYRHLIEDVNSNPNKHYAIVIPLDSELDRFLSEQLLKPFGKDNLGHAPKRLEEILIPISKGKEIIYTRFVKRFNRNGIPVLTLYNDAKIFFYSASNAENHIPGNTFRMVIQDEWSKFKFDITNIIQPTLIHENGTLISTTTLNENDPNNWFAKMIESFKSKSVQVITQKEKTKGLEIYQMKAHLKLDVIDKDFNTSVLEVNTKRLLIIGDFENIYPFIHNGIEIYARVQSDLQLGVISQENYELLYRFNPKVKNIQVLNNFRSDVNCLEVEEDIENLCSFQLVGYDHGKGADKTAACGWARIGIIMDKDNPEYEQYIILESGDLQHENAELQNVSSFLANFNLPIACDNTLFATSFSGPNEYPNVYRFFKYEAKLQKLMFPYGGKALKNDSRTRITFWEKALLISTEDSIIKYKKPFTDELGCQIYILQDKYKPDLNIKLIEQIENWKLKPSKNGTGLKEPRKSVIDIWDAASMAIEGYQKNKIKILSYNKLYTSLPKSLNIQTINRNSPFTGNPRMTSYQLVHQY